MDDDGARQLVRDIQLGEALTAEMDGQPCPVCGLDADGGVVRTNLPWIFGPAGGAVEVRVTAIGSAGVETGYVNAWIDGNQNGQMDAAEQILFDAPAPVGTTQTLTFDIPDGVNTLQDIYYARFRLYSTPQMLLGSGALPTGVAYEGEVEDYRWQFIPTAVTLAALLHGPVSATVQAPTGVTLSGISASPAAGSMPAAGVLLALLAPLAGAVWALRRRP